MQGHRPGAAARHHPEGLWDLMSTIADIRPLFASYDVVVALGVGGPHLDLVDDLRRTALRRTRFRVWLRHATTWGVSGRRQRWR